MKNMVFRVDASYEIGTGHVMRCLTLAQELKESGVKVHFICRELDGNLNDLIEDRGFIVYRLKHTRHQQIPQKTMHSNWLGVPWEVDMEETKSVLQNIDKKINWLIVDHYAIDADWENKLQPYVENIMVIDDLADRKHDCDLLLDQNYYKNEKKRYNSLIPKSCKQYLGPNYLLLRKEFIKVQQKMKQNRENINRIFVFFGGSDPTNQTGKVLKAIKGLNNNLFVVDVVVGKNNPIKKTIEEICESMPSVNYYNQIDNMAELMLKADLAIGAGGTTLWERCYLGLPSIVIIVAQNQIEMVRDLEEKGIIFNLGWHKKVNSKMIKEKINQLIKNPEEIKVVEKKLMEFMQKLHKVEVHPVVKSLLGDE